MPNILLALVFGLPATGKTTLCQSLLRHGLASQCRDPPKLAESCSSSSNNKLDSFQFIHVCYDNIIPLAEQQRLALNARKHDAQSETQELWKDIRNAVLNNIENLICTLKNNSDITTILSTILSFNFSTNIRKLSITNSDPFIILVDDNLYYRSMRYAFYLMAAVHEISFCELFFDLPLPSALRNNNIRNLHKDPTNLVPNEVIVKMSKKMEPPLAEKFKWEIFNAVIKSPFSSNEIPTTSISIKEPVQINSELESLSINTDIDSNTDEYHPSTSSNQTGIGEKVFFISESVRKDLVNLFLQCLDSPVMDRQVALSRQTEAATSRIICSKSVAHQADLLLRQCVSASMEGKKTAQCNASCVSAHAKAANKSRQNVLQMIKDGSPVMPPCMTAEYDVSMTTTIKPWLIRNYILEIERLTDTEEKFVGSNIGEELFNMC